jgi:hypothetical protein
MPIPGVPKLLNTFAFEDLGDGRTKLEMRFGKPRSAKDRLIAIGILPMIQASVDAGLAALRPLIEEDAAARRAAAASAAEPEIPSSTGRNLREPIAAGAR